MAQIIILQNFAVEEFRGSLEGPRSLDQFIEVLNHGAAVLTRFSYRGAVYRLVGVVHLSVGENRWP
jgi:hypothetical protein